MSVKKEYGSPLQVALLEYRAKVTELERENAELKNVLRQYRVWSKPHEGYRSRFIKLSRRAEALVANKRKIKELPEWSQ